jgi:hypothetical protein
VLGEQVEAIFKTAVCEGFYGTGSSYATTPFVSMNIFIDNIGKCPSVS